MKQNYTAVLPKRDWVPEWLYRLLCVTMRPMMVRWPLRGLLHREFTRDEWIQSEEVDQ